MKRTFSLLLVLALCLSLCACGKSKVVSNVESLIGAIGEVTADSEAAIVEAEEAYKVLTDKEKEAVENYAVLADARTALNETLEKEQFRQSILGEWLDIKNEDSKVSFDEVGNCALCGTTCTYRIDGNSIYVSVTGMERVFTCEVDAEGIEHLKSENEMAEYTDFVKPKDWEHFQPKEIEITTENWQEYFEIREITTLRKNAFDEYTTVAPGFGVFLKDEYLEKLSGNMMKYYSDVSFEVHFTSQFRMWTLNKDTGEFSFGNVFSDDPYFTPPETDVISTQDFRVDHYENEEYVQDYMDNCFAATLRVGLRVGGIDAVQYFENPEVLRATGIIYLNP